MGCSSALTRPPFRNPLSLSSPVPKLSTSIFGRRCCFVCQFHLPPSVCAPNPQPRLPVHAAANADEDVEVEAPVSELRVPDAWLTPSRALQESEWLRVALHKWLDDEYCPEAANVEISTVAARSYCLSLMEQQSDVGDILLRMVADLEKVSFQESFHGPFSSANAAIQLITLRMNSIREKEGPFRCL